MSKDARPLKNIRRSSLITGTKEYGARSIWPSPGGTRPPHDKTDLTNRTESPPPLQPTTTQEPHRAAVCSCPRLTHSMPFFTSSFLSSHSVLPVHEHTVLSLSHMPALRAITPTTVSSSFRSGPLLSS